MASISIVMPIYNTIKFLPLRMETILSQTFRDWELIVVDNYSDDGSWEYLQTFKDPRMKMTRRERNGLYDCWNAGIKQAQGQYIYIATSDDTMTFDCLEKMVAVLQKHPECGMCMCGLDVIDENDRVIKNKWEEQYAQKFYESYLDQFHIRRVPLDGILHFGLHTLYLSITQLLIKREIFENVGLFSTQWGSAGDFEWEMRATMFYDTVYIPKKLATWRVHSRQATKEDDDIGKIRRMISMTESVIKYVKEKKPEVLKIDVNILKDLYKREIIECKLHKGPLKNFIILFLYCLTSGGIGIKRSFRKILFMMGWLKQDYFINNVSEMRNIIKKNNLLSKIEILPSQE